jgi:hypothetical protein
MTGAQIQGKNIMKTCCQVLWMCLLAPGLVYAGQIDSQSAGDIGNPQNVDSGFTFGVNPTITNSARSSHVTILQHGRATAGYDFYQFTNRRQGWVTLDVDSTPIGTNFDTQIGIWNSDGFLMESNDDRGDDPGDNRPLLIGGWYNSAIRNLELNPGSYIVGVSRYRTYFYDGPTFLEGQLIPEGGTYALNIVREYSTPEPGSMVLMLTGVAGAIVVRAVRRRQKNADDVGEQHSGV